MRGEWTAIDLETTGLDPSQDEIIEIGAVRVVDGQIVDEFSTLVHPGRAIPAPVTVLTGIQNDDLIGAPSIQAVLPQLQAFVGNTPLLGHNVGFDASFMHKHGLFRNNEQIDTYELASVLLPEAPRYALSQLTVMFGFDIQSAHRALYDARATAFIFNELWKRAIQLPVALLQEIVSLSSGLKWDGRSVFAAALEERLASGERASALHFPVFSAGRAPSHSLAEPLEIKSVAVDAVTDIFQKNGPLAAYLPAYEMRTQQIDMAEAVTDAFNKPHHAMIEAGTGTGKSYAYLVPAILWATKNQSRVVVSTNTINLQDQLMANDIPTLRQALGVDFRASVLKGRSNYICPHQLALARRRTPANIEELRTVAKVLVWLLTTTSGDRSELSLRGPEENLAWLRMSADNHACISGECQKEGLICPFHQARKAADGSHLIIVNHALLLADATSTNRVLPDYQYMIVDEAHHLEDAATTSLSKRIDAPLLHRQLSDLGDSNSGLLGRLMIALTQSTSEKTLQRFATFVGDISGVVRAMRFHVNRLFDAFRALLQEIDLPQETYSSIRVTDTIRSRTEFSSIQIVWHELSEFFEGLTSALQQLTSAGGRLEKLRAGEQEELFLALAGVVTELSDLQTHLNEFIHAPQENTIYWMQLGQTFDYVSLQSAPLHVGKIVQDFLWKSKRSVILTSATLRAGGDFRYMKDRLSAEDVEVYEIGSPFDYKSSTLLFLPQDMPDPNDKQKYQQQVERTLIDLVSTLNGRVLALFTSYAHLRQTSYAISPRLALGNIAIYDQSDGTSRQALLEGFKTSERAILMGTRSFWEGIDIPGEKLSAVVILRLPFAVPTDPVFAARSETYHNAFNEYTMPDAIVKFRQGFGRLIRTTTDRGIVVVLDSRVTSKGYGHNFIDALPDCTIQRGLLSGLPEAAKTWLTDKVVS